MTNRVMLHCVGDFYAREASVAQLQHDPSAFSAAVQLLSGAHVRFANLEAPLIDGGKPLPSSGVRLRSPVSTTGLLHHLGFDVVTIANNHMFDYGEAGVISTLDTLRAASLPFVGAGRTDADAGAPVFMTVGGRRLAFLGVCDDQGGGAGNVRPGVRLLNPARLEEDVRRARKEADHVIVGMHTGLEFVPAPEPFFLDVARRLIDAGADVIAGHHPHVPQGAIRHGRGIIACSLGDFLFDLPRTREEMTPHQRRFDQLHPVLEVALDDRGVVDHHVHWLARREGRYEIVKDWSFDVRREFDALSALANDPSRVREHADGVYRSNLYSIAYAVYDAFYFMIARRNGARFRSLMRWLPTLTRTPKRRFIAEGVRATGRKVFGRTRTPTAT